MNPFPYIIGEGFIKFPGIVTALTTATRYAQTTEIEPQEILGYLIGGVLFVAGGILTKYFSDQENKESKLETEVKEEA